MGVCQLLPNVVKVLGREIGSFYNTGASRQLKSCCMTESDCDVNLAIALKLAVGFSPLHPRVGRTVVVSLPQMYSHGIKVRHSVATMS
jgi:hypothetical protein